MTSRRREPEDELSSDTSTRLRSRRSRSHADSTSDGDTDGSDAPRRQRRRKTRSASEEETEETAPTRKRSLSTASNTSSTSTSSVASEPEQRRATLEQQAEELEQKRRMVEDGTLAEFCRRVAAFKEERNRLLQMAELHKNLQLKNGQDLYGFDVQRAHHLWQHGKDVLKAELLAKVDAVMAKLQEEMKALSQSGAKVSDVTKKPKEKPVKFVAVVKSDKQENEKPNEADVEEGEVAEPAKKKPAVVKRRKMDDVTDVTELSDLLPEEAVRLPFDDVTADFAAILNDRKETTKASIELLPNAGNLPFKLERRKLYCGKYVFEDGDEVVIESPLVNEKYTGTISSITDVAIYIKLPSDQKVRIFLPHLERGRCEIKPLLRGTVATGSLQSMGWTEYDEDF